MEKDSVRGIIFDYGGTLDTNGRHWANVLWEAYQYIGIDVSEEAFRQAYVYGERALARHSIIQPQDNFHTLLRKKVELELSQLPVSEVDRKAVEVADYCDQYVRRVMNLSKEMLALLSERYPLVLVSNFYGNLHAVLTEYGLGGYFQQVIESTVVGVRKPNPEIFRLGVKALDMLATEVCVVGDSFEKDIIPAIEVGCHTVWFKGEEWMSAVHDEALSDAIITDIRQLSQTFCST